MNLKVEIKASRDSDERAEVESAHKSRRGADEEAIFEDHTNSFRRINISLDFKCRRNSEQQWSQVINNR